MKKTMKFIKDISHVIGIASFIVTGIALLPSCDIVDEPYLKEIEGNNDTTPVEQHVRKVLLEDFTGQKCPNCPDAAVIAHTLQEVYGEQIVIVAVHAGNFAIPDGTFTADFRTTEGDELNSFFNISMYGYPMGLINRTEYNGYPVVPKENWETAFGLQVEMDVQADISIVNDWNSGTRKLDCMIETEFLEDLDGTYNICAFITESGIISPQQTSGGIVQDYVHNHMLRGSLNGTWGDLVGTDGLAIPGSKLTNSYTFTLPAEWVAENCAIVAYVYNTETLVVLQAEEEALVMGR